MISLWPPRAWRGYIGLLAALCERRGRSAFGARPRPGLLAVVMSSTLAALSACRSAAPTSVTLPTPTPRPPEFQVPNPDHLPGLPADLYFVQGEGIWRWPRVGGPLESVAILPGTLIFDLAVSESGRYAAYGGLGTFGDYGVYVGRIDLTGSGQVDTAAVPPSLQPATDPGSIRVTDDGKAWWWADAAGGRRLVVYALAEAPTVVADCPEPECSALGSVAGFVLSESERTRRLPMTSDDAATEDQPAALAGPSSTSVGGRLLAWADPLVMLQGPTGLALWNAQTGELTGAMSPADVLDHLPEGATADTGAVVDDTAIVAGTAPDPWWGAFGATGIERGQRPWPGLGLVGQAHVCAVGPTGVLFALRTPTDTAPESGIWRAAFDGAPAPLELVSPLPDPVTGVGEELTCAPGGSAFVFGSYVSHGSAPSYATLLVGATGGATWRVTELLPGATAFAWGPGE